MSHSLTDVHFDAGATTACGMAHEENSQSRTLVDDPEDSSSVTCLLCRSVAEGARAHLIAQASADAELEDDEV